jgi:hypothetical protein
VFREEGEGAPLDRPKEADFDLDARQVEGPERGIQKKARMMVVK